jgi:hypothetical protein
MPLKVHGRVMHIAGVWVLLIFIVACAVAMLILLHRTRAGRILHERIPDRPRRRLFLAAVSFFLTFLGVRLLVYAIVHHVGPFGWVMLGGRHIHHLVWGILLLLLVGYMELAEFGTGSTPGSIFASRLISICFGTGAALTLDEFALWLNLDPQAYWTHEGRASIDAVVLFGALLAIGAWGAPLWSRRRPAPPRQPA